MELKVKCDYNKKIQILEDIMIYIIGLIVLAIIFQLLFGESGCGCLITCLVVGGVLFLLWRFGILSLLIKLFGAIMRFIFKQAVKMYYRIVDEDTETEEYGFEFLDLLDIV